MKNIINDPSAKRINKFISESGYCSRREADRLVEEGCVKINGKKAILGSKVYPEDEVSIKGKIITKKSRPIYLAFNKPVGVICTTAKDVKNNIVSYIHYPTRIFPIGRLDRASEGLIFLTNDGDIVNKILRSRNNHEKEYIVTVNKWITKDFLKRMSKGLPILNTITKPCFIEQISRKEFRIILTQGLNRQIRRMCSHLNYEVLKLKRIRIMNIKLDNLKIGKWRKFTEEEFEEINKLLSDSKKIA